jgi:hypothetical protein
METRPARWWPVPWPAASAILSALRAFGWMAGGFGVAVLVLVAHEQASTPERPVPWEALGWFLLALGAAGLGASAFAPDAWRPRLFGLGAGVLVSPGLLLAAPPPWMALPGLAVPVLAVALLRRRPEVQVAALALLALAFVALQSAVPRLGGERGVLYLAGAAAAALTFLALPREGPWTPQRAWLPPFALAAALPFLLAAA